MEQSPEKYYRNGGDDDDEEEEDEEEDQKEENDDEEEIGESDSDLKNDEVNLWDKLRDEVINEVIDAQIQASNRLLLVYLQYLRWYHDLKTDPVHKKVIKTLRRFMEDDEMD